MDSVTHLVAGALTPLAFSKAPKSRWLIPFGILCGEFPDIDILAGRSAEALLIYHRGITHALVLQPLFALCLAAIFHKLMTKNTPQGSSWTFGKTWLVAFTALMIHLFLDCMTTFGTQIFLPFSDYRVALPSMFIVDLLLTLPLIALLWLALRRNRQAGSRSVAIPLARAGIVWMLVYPVVCLGIGQGAKMILAECYVTDAPNAIRTLHITPEPFAPLNWKIIAEKGTEQYSMAGLFLPQIGKELQFKDFTRPQEANWNALQRDLPIMKAYADFVSFPIIYSSKPNDTGQEIIYSDLRYASTIPHLMEALGRTDGIFLFVIRYDTNGTPTQWRFLHRGKEADTTPWNEYPPDQGTARQMLSLTRTLVLNYGPPS